MASAVSKRQLNFVKPKFQVHVFRKEVTDQKIIYQVIKMIDSLFICINKSEDMSFSNLSLATLSRYETLPIGTCLMGSFVDETSKLMAVRLAKKLNKVVFISCNAEDKLMLPLIEKHLFEEIRNRPECF